MIVVPIGDKDDIVHELRDRYGALRAHRSADEIYAAYQAWLAAGKPYGLRDWLRETLHLDAA